MTKIIRDSSILDELEAFDATLQHYDDEKPVVRPVPTLVTPYDIIDQEDADEESGALSPFSQDALACALGRSGWDTNAKYVDEWGRWCQWNGSHWEVDKKMVSFTLIRKFLRAEVVRLVTEAQVSRDMAVVSGLGEDEIKSREKLVTAAIRNGKDTLQKNGIAAVESLSRSNVASAALVEDFDGDLMLLGTPGGTVDLKTGILRPGEREDMITKMTRVTPAGPGAKPEKFLKFLHTILDGDEEVIGFIKRYFGYALTGSVEEHKVAFFYGEGRNGKGVLMNTVYELLGDYARRSPVETFLKKVSSHPTDIAGLAGARFVVGSEVPAGTTWNEAQIKDMTGGDILTARLMRQDYFDFMPQFTLFLHGNDQPAFRSVGTSIRERMVLVPFSRTFTEDERNTKLQREMIDEEGPEILRWMIEGAVEWARRAEDGKSGLGVPDILKKASKEYFDREDEIGEFINDEMILDASEFISGSDIFAKFQSWNDQRGGERRSQREIMKELRKRGLKDARSGTERGLKGLRAITGQDRADMVG
ncbi:phage/plasmid primase, P4 family [Sulfitobacter guttiformis]|nr:phage/plasmid primase, P4 family [Sulfitobacter guttiformis]KIN72680.1 Phage/plasmid primase, P4 family [Sulfitobacter guttiformis KCTC 32187]